MPVILEPGSEEMKMWLDPRRRWDMELQKLLKPYVKPLECYPVKTEVGKVGNNSPSFIVPLDSAENKGNIKNFFGAGLKKDSQPKTPIIDTSLESIKKEVGEDVTQPDTRDTRDDDEIHELDPETNAPLPTPSQPEPSPSPTKSAPTTPLFARSNKRKLADMSPATTLPPIKSSPLKSPSPLKAQASYSSTSIGSGPKKGVFSSSADGSPVKRAKTKALDPKDLGNTDIKSFFAKK